MEERAKIPPGLPLPRPTTSYWQTPPAEIADHLSSSSLPATADYVIIGSGISGACVAHNLLERRPDASVVMLEARQACSGATGRNGGHTKAASYRSFLAHEEHYGVSEAIKIARLEYANINATHAFAKNYAIDCDSSPCDTVDIIYDPLLFEAGKKAIARMRETMGHSDPAAAYQIYTASETAEKLHCPGAVGALSYTGGSVSSYKLVIGLLKRSLSKGLKLYTNTAALSLSNPNNPSLPGTRISTAKGTITTPTVILATNGYTAHLLPQFQGLIVPLRGQISAQRPGSIMPALHTTYSFIYTAGYEYMIPRPAGTPDAGTIVIGGGLGTLPDEGAAEYGRTDDGALNETLSAYLTETSRRYFGCNWGDDDDRGRIVAEWSGIMGTSADGLPYVGKVPAEGMDGVWVSASFNGHGMVMCLKCAEALVGRILDGGWNEDFPEPLKMGKARLGNKFLGRAEFKKAPGEAIFGDKEGSGKAIEIGGRGASVSRVGWRL